MKASVKNSINSLLAIVRAKRRLKIRTMTVEFNGSNLTAPVSISNISVPRLHQSTAFP